MELLTPSIASKVPRPTGGFLVGLAAVIALLYFGRIFFITVTVALILALILDPIVSFCMRLRMPRGVACFVTCSVALLAVYFAAVAFYTQAAGLLADLPAYSQRINEMVDNTRELLGTALEANFSLISIAQSDVSRKFAGWAAIIAVPTMVAGFYGMNFKFIPESDWQYGFYAVLLFTIGACLLLYYLFKRSGWL